MKKWRVRKKYLVWFDDSHHGVQSGWRWCVHSPNGVSWGSYPTWEEAVAKADRESSTRTVVLPADPRHAGQFAIRGTKKIIIT